MTLKNVELRKLPAGKLYSIATILETNNDWKKVMSLIPRNPRNEHFEAKYNNEHIKQIEDHARVSNRKCAEILFEEWGTSGRIRPTLNTLKDVAQKANIYRVADEIAQMLGEAPPTRPDTGPEALINTNVTDMLRTTYMFRKDQKSYGKNMDQRAGNHTTIQMKSASNLIAFSLSCNDLPNISAMNMKFGDKSTAKMKSENDLVKYTDELIEDYNSSYLPNFEEILSKTKSFGANSNSNEEVNQGTDISSPFPGMKVNTGILENTQLVQFSYKQLESMTKNFAKNVVFTEDPPNCKMAGRIGSGGFADVYVGYHPNYGHLAVKKPRPNPAYEKKPEIPMRVFNSELKFLSQYKQKNIIALIGFSTDGPYPCIVCEYIDGGTLEKKLEEKILTEKQRINIMTGVAEGLKYLHSSAAANLSSDALTESGSQSSKKYHFVHGDIKTANILLTKDYVPKLCDFALGKQYEATNLATYLMATPAYLAPEGFSGTITQETDIYSYGIVLLELLTGQKSIVKTSAGDINIKTYLEENSQNNEITNYLDPFIDKWTKAKEIYGLARSCLQTERKSRPNAEVICDTLTKINGE